MTEQQSGPALSVFVRCTSQIRAGVLRAALMTLGWSDQKPLERGELRKLFNEMQASED